MAGMTDQTWVGKLLDFSLHGSAAPTAPTQPLHLRLYSVAGSETASGTEMTSSNFPGYTAGGATMGNPAFAACSSGVSSNNNAVSWTASGTQTAAIVAVEIWDTAGTPVRLLWGTIASVSGLATGNVLSFAAGAVTADGSQW